MIDAKAIGILIDQKAAAAHQWLVDKSERKPAWWAEQLAWAYGIFGSIGYVLVKGEGTELFWLGMLFLAGVALLFVARTPALLSMFGTKGFFRCIFWVDLVARTILFIESPTNWRAAYILNSALILSYLYFATCKPPRPRKRQYATGQLKGAPPPVARAPFL